MTKKILIILHQEHSTPGRVGPLLQTRGYQLDIRKPRFGDILPDTLENHAGAIIFGGPMSSNDPDDFIKYETDWIKVALKEKAPFLGICLGAQMLARHIGGKVYYHPEGHVEIGYHPLDVTADGRALMDWPQIVYHWNREGFEVPKSATLLATGDIFSHQAFSYGTSAFGIQFHSELTLAMMHRWTVHGAPRLEFPKAQPRREHLTGRAIYDADTLRWLNNFLDIWLQSDQRN
ncbi:MAG: glutamine amidotransferase [Fimbriimonadaceae bacterium]|nr:glutamine amidotransferase [Alphaproteobacteria bacterium]